MILSNQLHPMAHHLNEIRTDEQLQSKLNVCTPILDIGYKGYDNYDLVFTEAHGVDLDTAD